MNTKEQQTIDCNLELYTITPDGHTHKLSKARIDKRIITISELPYRKSTYHSLFFSEYLFEYTFAVPYNKTIFSDDGKELKLNTQFQYDIHNLDYNFKVTQVCYTHLTWLQKLKISYHFINFRGLWSQENIKLIIGILITLFLSVYKCSHNTENTVITPSGSVTPQSMPHN
jgi:hypothetical protein